MIFSSYPSELDHFCTTELKILICILYQHQYILLENSTPRKSLSHEICDIIYLKASIIKNIHFRAVVYLLVLFSLNLPLK